MSDQLRINGNAVSWGSIILKLNGESFTGFTQISYGDKRERSHVWGMGRHHAPRARTRGKYTPDAVKISGPKGSAQALRNMLALKAVDGRSIGDVVFQINVQYVEVGDIPMNVLIQDCVLIGDASSHDEGPDYLKDELEVSCMRIWRNGQTLYDASAGVP
jgi:hypothetical protein